MRPIANQISRDLIIELGGNRLFLRLAESPPIPLLLPECLVSTSNLNVREVHRMSRNFGIGVILTAGTVVAANLAIASMIPKEKA